MTDTAKKASTIPSELLGSVYPSLKSVASSTKKWDNLPPFDELPPFKNYTGCAWGVWGEDDQLGTINLLTDEIVKEAAAKEIK